MQNNITHEVVLVTKEMAAVWLATSKGNRKIRRGWLSAIKRLMVNGQWILTHQAICFDENGHLIDGHHRLLAILATGISVRMTVARGYSHETFIALDQGANRNVSDIHEISTKVASVIRYAARVLHPGKNTSAAYIPDLVTDLIRSPFHAAVMDVTGYCGKNTIAMSSAPVRFAASYYTMFGDDGAREAYKRLVTLDYNSMTPVEQTFAKQIATGLAAPKNERDFLTRCMRVFDPNCSQHKVINVTEAMITSCYANVRSELRKMLDDRKANHDPLKIAA